MDDVLTVGAAVRPPVVQGDLLLEHRRDGRLWAIREGDERAVVALLLPLVRARAICLASR